MKKVKVFEDFINESINVKYWADYNKNTSGQGDPSHAIKYKVFDIAFEEAVETWNAEADGKENQIDDKEANKIEKLAKEFFKKAGWISINVIHAMIAQEGIDESLEINETGGSLKVEKQKDGKYYWTFTFKSGKTEKSFGGFNTSAEAQKDFMYRSKFLKESTINESAEEKEAKAILQDLLDEYDPWEIGDMTEEEAKETVDAYGHKGTKAKKIAEILYDLATSGIFESKKINEAKELDRDAFITLLKDKYKFTFVRTSEDFDGSKGGIWTSGESSPLLGGKKIYNYYGEGSAYDLGVLKKFENTINGLGWYSEWYDAGTIMIWPN